MKEHVTQPRVTHLCDFNSVWWTVELYGTEESDKPGGGYTENTC